jgi:class 3 adenylate cyclase
MVQQIFEMFLDIDVRHVLPTIHVPTLVLHRRRDRVVNRRAGEQLAAQIPGARYVELEGIDHLPWAGDAEAVLGEIEEFLTGTRSVAEPDRVLATVMFTDICGSTARAAELGDAAWRELLAAYQAAVRRELERVGAREVKTLGDGSLATFDGHLQPGSPALGSFGPGMMLANDLLQKGERDTVLEFFALCGTFWTSGSQKLASWADTVRNGGVPNFVANLAY